MCLALKGIACRCDRLHWQQPPQIPMKNKPSKKKPFVNDVTDERLAHAKKMRGYLPHYLSRLMNALNLRLMNDLRLHRITAVQFRVMQMLDARGSASIGEIAADTVIAQSVVSRVIDQLERSGFARRRKRIGDGRSVDVSLTPNGSKMYNALFPSATRIVDDAMRELSASERDTLEALLLRVYKGVIQPYESWDVFVRKGRL
jgi:DNA-binding MarR family transcriptional regulator